MTQYNFADKPREEVQVGLSLYNDNVLSFVAQLVLSRASERKLSSDTSIFTMMFRSLATAIALLASSAAATIYYAGVAESSGEFGVWSRFTITCSCSQC